MQNNPELETQSGDERFSDALFGGSTENDASLAAPLSRPKREDMFCFEDCNCELYLRVDSSSHECRAFATENILRKHSRKSLRTWYASDVLLSDHNSNKRHSTNVIKEDILFSGPKKRRSCRIIYPSSDGDEYSLPKINAQASRTVHEQLHWNTDSVNSELLLRHTSNISGINSPMYYIGTENTFFSYHVENEQLSFIPYIAAGHPKVWYVVPRAFKLAFKTSVAKYLLLAGFPKSHRGGVKQIFGTNFFFINLFMLKKPHTNTKISRFV